MNSSLSKPMFGSTVHPRTVSCAKVVVVNWRLYILLFLGLLISSCSSMSEVASGEFIACGGQDQTILIELLEVSESSEVVEAKLACNLDDGRLFFEREFTGPNTKAFFDALDWADGNSNQVRFVLTDESTLYQIYWMDMTGGVHFIWNQDEVQK